MYGVLGHSGFLGINLCQQLKEKQIPYVGGSRRNGVDARDINSLIDWITSNRITHLINLAADCGGIGLNKDKPARLWSTTTQISHAVLEAAVVARLQKLTMIGTVCSYAGDCPVPFQEADLMRHGFPEITNAPYGVAKLNGYFGCLAYRKQHNLDAIFLVPVNLYGPYDNFDPKSSHVIPAIIRKCVEATKKGLDYIDCWGTGEATREFLYASEAARAIITATESYSGEEPINLGSGSEISIKDLTHLIAELVGFTGEIRWDSSQPNGQMRRCLDVSRARDLLGFENKVDIVDGLTQTIQWYQNR